MKIEDICKSLDKPVSVYTVAHVLKKTGYGHWKAQKRPHLNEEKT